MILPWWHNVIIYRKKNNGPISFLLCAAVHIFSIFRFSISIINSILTIYWIESKPQLDFFLKKRTSKSDKKMRHLKTSDFVYCKTRKINDDWSNCIIEYMMDVLHTVVCIYQALIKIVFHIQWNWHNPQHYQIDDLDSRLNWNEIIVLYRKYECHIHKQNRKKPDYHQRLWFGEINKKKVLIFLKRIYLSLGNFSTIISPQTRTHIFRRKNHYHHHHQIL